MPRIARCIEGRALSLEEGERYLAEQLILDGGGLTVAIYSWNPVMATWGTDPAAMVEDLSLEEADAFVARFNGESSTTPGREW